MKNLFTSEKFLQWGDELVNWILQKTLMFVLAIVFLIIAFKVLKVLMRFLKSSFQRSNMDVSVATFLLSFINISLKVIFLVVAAGIIGLKTTSLVTILGSAGIAVGLALQGSLSNIAGGVLILLLKPFRVGDYIIEDNKGNEGTVMAIDIFYTRLQSADNKTIVIPNGILSNSSLTNVTKQDKRRLDLYVSIEYSQNLHQVKELLMEVIKEEEHVLLDDEISIFVSEFEASSLRIGVRAWVPMDFYWLARWSALEHIKDKLDGNNIQIAYNHLNVNVKNVDKIELSKS